MKMYMRWIHFLLGGYYYFSKRQEFIEYLISVILFESVIIILELIDIPN